MNVWQEDVLEFEDPYRAAVLRIRTFHLVEHPLSDLDTLLTV